MTTHYYRLQTQLNHAMNTMDKHNGKAALALRHNEVETAQAYVDSGKKAKAEAAALAARLAAALVNEEGEA